MASAEEPLFEQEPYDQITLDAPNNNAVLKVEPLNLPGRRVPAPLPKSGQLTVRLQDRPGKTYAIEWYSVAKVELFEQMVLDKANELAGAGRLEEAYEYFKYLEAKDPKLPGVAEGIDAYLYEEAKAMQRAGQTDGALAMLREMHARGSQRPELEKALGVATDKLVEGYVAKEEFRHARALVRNLAAWYPQHEIVAKWQGDWQQQAEALAAEAKQALDSGQLRKASQAGRRIVQVWPALPGAKALLQAIYARYPRVVVGVTVPASAQDPSRLDDWAARRSGRLLYRPLMEFAGPGREGGRYDCPLGEVRIEDLGRRLVFRLKPGLRWASSSAEMTGYDLSRHLLAMADPGQPAYRAEWAEILAGVSVRDVYEVHAELRRAYVRPEALLETVVPPYTESASAGAGAAANGPYRVDAEAQAADQVTYVANPDYFAAGAAQPKEIVEQRFAEGAEAIRALRLRQIDVIDRVNPWELEQLRAQPDVAVEEYAMPLIHCLVPNVRRPLLSNRGFRRALLYGIHRQIILAQLLGGQTQQGCQVTSGPFSPGVVSDDPLDYACDPTIEPRAYDPRLALALAEVAFRELVETKKKRGEALKAMPTLVLAHPPHEIARAACTAIQRQLGFVGIPVTLKEMLPGPTPVIPDDVDLLYAELAMWEPVVDARRVLDADGLSGGASPYMSLALRQLEQASDWPQIGARLRRIHRIAYDDVAVIPLWQLTDHFAYHKSLQGVGGRPVGLYQNVEQWQPAFYYAPEEP